MMSDDVKNVTARPEEARGERPAWLEHAAADAFRRAQRIKKSLRGTEGFAQYQNDPAGFCRDVLGMTHLTDDIIRMMESVRDNIVTIARSSNGTGKSYTSGHLGLWWFLCFQDSRVYLTAAPPERNLIDNVWAHVMTVVRNKPTLFTGYKLKRAQISRTPDSFIEGVTIPLQGTAEARQAKFCADADDLFEMSNGKIVRYGDLVGRKDVPVVSVDQNLERQWEFAEFFDNGVKNVYEIEMEDGEIVRRTGNHPFYAGWNIQPDYHTYGGLHPKGRIRPHEEGWVEVARLEEGYALLGPCKTDFTFGIEEIDRDGLKFLAYMIGDGCFRGKNRSEARLQFTQERNAQLGEFISVLDELGAKYSVSDNSKYNWVCVDVQSALLKRFVSDVGLANCKSEHKFIPGFVFSLTKDQIAVFLNRLFSTDGWACVTNKAEIGYSSKSKRLVFDIQRLLRKFGILARISSKVVRWGYDEEERAGQYWSLYISNSFDVIQFAEQIGIYGKESGVDDCYEYAQSRLWPYAEWRFEKPSFRWRKIKSIKIIGERPTVGVSVPENHTYLTSLVEHNSGKHASHIMFIVDEGDAVPEEIYKGIESCMSNEHPRLLILFNPRAPQGKIFDMESNGRAKVVELTAFAHPNVITGREVIPGAVSRSVTVKRINEWTRPLARGEKADSSCFEVPDFLVGTTTVSDSGINYPPLPGGFRKVFIDEFWYMTLAKYPSSGVHQLVAPEWVDMAIGRGRERRKEFGDNPPTGIRPILGLDCAEYGGDNNSLAIRYDYYIAPLESWGGLDTTETTDKTLVIYKQLDPEILQIDALGVGSTIAPLIVRLGRDENPPVDVCAFAVKVSREPSKMTFADQGEFYSIRDEIWWRLREFLRTNPNAILPDDPLLAQEIKTATYTYTDSAGRSGGKIKVMSKEEFRKQLKRSPDRADGVCLTFNPMTRATVMKIEG